MSITRSRLLAMLAMVALVVGSVPLRSASAADPEFSILRTFGSYASAIAINDSGTVVGIAWFQSGSWHAVHWDAGQKDELPADLGTLGGPNSEAHAVNSAGQIVGVANTSEKIPMTNMYFNHAALWENGTVTDLGTLPGGLQSYATGINDGGLIAGYASAASGDWRAVVWLNEADRPIVDLGTLGGRAATAEAINNHGQVVGWANTVDGKTHATLWDLQSGKTIDLGTLGGQWSHATAINDAGQVVGWSETASGEQRAFVWDDQAGMRALGTLGGTFSKAEAINDAGQIVGVSTTADNKRHAVLWENDSIVDVQGAVGLTGYVSLQFLGINDAGIIAGVGHGHLGNWGPILVELLTTDATAPVLNLPDDMVVNATSPAGAVVDYTAGATDDQDPAPQVSCEPPSGAVLPIGMSEVRCATIDASGNISEGMFQVTVLGAGDQIDNLIEVVESFDLNRGIERSLIAKLDSARDSLERAGAGSSPSACGKLGAFANHAEAQTGKHLTLDQGQELVEAAQRIRAVMACA